MKTKLLFVLPHCSTGGMPQFVLKQIQTFKDQYDISVIEVSYSGADFVVQRNQIRKISNFISLYGNQENLPVAIDKINPDIVYFEEVPESFLSLPIVSKIYRADRNYKILVTPHGSLTKREDFTYIPDKVVTVSDWQFSKFKEMLDTDIDIWKYPIEPRHTVSPEEKREARRKLGESLFAERMNGTYGAGTANVNVLNVGLFTPGKNQEEIFNDARRYPYNNYHFVGNQAGNFQFYWGPLMANKPLNCIIWRERTDTDLFFQAADEFYFSSKFELMPLVMKEAISWGLPIRAHKLETYGNEFDNYNINWI